MTLYFCDGACPTKETGPYPGLRIDRETLRANGTELAQHRESRWYVSDTECYPRIECHGQLVVTFEAAQLRSRMLGPYLSLCCLDGTAYANHEIFAFYDRKQQAWYSFDLDGHFTSLIVRPLASI